MPWRLGKVHFDTDHLPRVTAVSDNFSIDNILFIFLRFVEIWPQILKQVSNKELRAQQDNPQVRSDACAFAAPIAIWHPISGALELVIESHVDGRCFCHFFQPYIRDFADIDSTYSD